MHFKQLRLPGRSTRSRFRCWSMNFVLFILFGLGYLGAFGQSALPEQLPNIAFPPTNGTVEVVEYDSIHNQVYLGGSFTKIGLRYSYLAKIDSATGDVPRTYPKANSTVNAVVSDGNGGWYIGGSFSLVGDSTRSRLAHINASGEVSAWNPSVNSTVWCLALKGDTLFVGGQFSSIGSNSAGISRLAAVSTTTDTAMTGWNPNVNSTVYELLIHNQELLAGGAFTSVNSNANYKYLVAIDPQTGLARNWIPNPNNQVEALVASNDTLFVGGHFTTMGGQTHNRLSAVNLTTGLPMPWNIVGPSSAVRTLARRGDTLYVGGDFSNWGNSSGDYVRGVSISTGSGVWLPATAPPNGSVYTIHLAGNAIYLGGTFTTISSRTIGKMARLHSVTGAIDTSFNVIPSSTVLDIKSQNGKLFVGGSFPEIGGVLRNRAAAVDGFSGQILPWDPNCQASVFAIKSIEGKVFLGGTFTTLGGVSRVNIGAVNTTDGSLLSWYPSSGANGDVHALELYQNQLMIGGRFTNCGGATRYKLAAVDTNNATLSAWTAAITNSSQYVNTLKVYNNLVYVGGLFTAIGNRSNDYLAAVDANSGSVTTWIPQPNSAVYGIETSADGTLVFAVGNFTTVGGVSRVGIAAINATNGTLHSWNPGQSNTTNVREIKRGEGDRLFVGGLFTNIGSQPLTVPRLATFSFPSDSADTWVPNPNSYVFSIAISPSFVYTGGSFTNVDGDGCFREFATYNLPCIPGALTSSPTSQSYCAGDSLTFSVGTTGRVDSVVWQVSSNGGQTWTALNNGNGISGARQATLTLNPAAAIFNLNQFRAEAWACGNPIGTSSSATLTGNSVTSVSCPPSDTVTGQFNACTASYSYATVVFNSACGIDSTVLTSGLASGSSFPAGVNTVVWTGYAGGQTGTCAFNITVLDQQPPVAACQPDTLYFDANGQAPVDPSQLDNGSSDNCTNLTFYAGVDTANCVDDIGTNPITLIVEDVGGNTATCQTTLTVFDTLNPLAVCRDTALYLDTNGVVLLTPALLDDGSADNCSIDTYTLSATTFTIADTGAANIVVLTVTDPSGNTASCNSQVTVLDNGGLFVFCPGDTTLYADSGFCATSYTYPLPGVQHNCPTGGSAPISDLSIGDLAFSGFKTFSTPDTFSFVALKPLANGTAITFTDRGWMAAGYFYNVLGDSTCFWEANQTIPAGTHVWIAGLTSSHGAVTGSVIDFNGSRDQVFAYQGTEPNASDMSGFVAALQMNDVWQSNGGNARNSALPPVFTNFVNTMSLTPRNTNGTFDCSTTTGDSATLMSALVTPANWTLDASASAFPMPTCPLTVTGQGGGGSGGTYTPTLSSGQGSGNPFPVGTNTEVWEVSDNCGNTNFCSFTITVLDTLAPFAICHDTTVYLDINGQAMLPPAMVDNGSFDFCAPVNLSVSPNTFTQAEIGTNTVQLTVTDPSGNFTKCAAVVTVIDTIPPPCTYVLGNDSLECSQLDFSNGLPTYCLPLLTTGVVNGGIIGLDYCIQYDPGLVQPVLNGNTGVGHPGAVMLNGSNLANVDVTLVQPGELRVSLSYGTLATFSGFGEVACVEFQILTTMQTGSVATFTSCELLESYLSSSQFGCADPGSVTVHPGDYYSGRLVYRNEVNRPLRYDTLIPTDYRLTTVALIDSSCTTTFGDSTSPDQDGYFDLYTVNGTDFTIIRDLPGDVQTGTCPIDVSDFINGQDAYVTTQVTTHSGNFTPTVWDLLSMDVNLDGFVTAGDRTLMSARTIQSICQFPQATNNGGISKDWIHFEKQKADGDPAFQISSTYPADDGVGYSRYRVPPATFCFDIDSNRVCAPDSVLFYSVLLGDANGNWDGDSTPVALKTDLNNGLVLDLNDAEWIQNCEVRVPLLWTGSQLTNLSSFDFKVMVDPAKARFLGASLDGPLNSVMNIVQNSNLNRRLQATAYSTASAPLSAQGLLGWVELELIGSTPTLDYSDWPAADLRGYYNGDRVGMEVVGSLDCAVISARNTLSAHRLVVYPNPLDRGAGSESVFVAYEPAAWAGKVIEVVDLMGRVLLQFETDLSGRSEVDLSGVGSGVWLLRSEGVIVGKVVKM